MKIYTAFLTQGEEQSAPSAFTVRTDFKDPDHNLHEAQSLVQ